MPTGADSIGQRCPAGSLTFLRKAFHQSVELSAFRWRHRDHTLGDEVPESDAFAKTRQLHIVGPSNLRGKGLDFEVA